MADSWIRGKIYLRTQVGGVVGFNAKPSKQMAHTAFEFVSREQVLQPVLHAKTKIVRLHYKEVIYIIILEHYKWIGPYFRDK